MRASTVFLIAACAIAACSNPPREASRPPRAETPRRLPTGAYLDPAGRSVDVGSMPLAIALAPDREHVVLLLSGWREQGIQVVSLASGKVVQTVTQPAAFIGVAFSPNGQYLYASGGNTDVIYRYTWLAGRAKLVDSLVLAIKADPRQPGTRYPAGLAVSRDGRLLYVAENLADSLAVVDIEQRRVVARFATERYPYGVVVAPDGTVYVSAWGGNTVSVFAADSRGMPLESEYGVQGVQGVQGVPGGSRGRGRREEQVGRIVVGRHPSAMLLNGEASRLFVVSGSTDRVAVVDTKSRQVIAELRDAPPAGPAQGSTPNALALSPDGARLFVAEADNNAIAVFDLSVRTADILAAKGADALVGRFPVGWYPTALLADGRALLVVNGKGRGSGPNPDGPTPVTAKTVRPRAYTLGQTSGTIITLEYERITGVELGALTARVASLNGWDQPARTAPSYPPFEHVIYIIKENRTYDQVLGDLAVGDGDTSLVFFPRAVSPNHHALAERFGVFDRFFVNAEVSADGHNWSMAAYTTDYLQKTVASQYSARGRSYDYEGNNRGSGARDIPEDDVNAPANGYLWDLAQRGGITFRNYGEFVVPERQWRGDATTYRGNKPFLASHTHPTFPGYDLDIPDQLRADIWIAELADFSHVGRMPQLSIVRLPNDHTSGLAAGARTPRAHMADNDLALGRMIEALSKSPFWRNTVVFVVEDDAQNGPDHVDSHRAPFYIISPYNRGGVHHQWANTTDAIATMAEILNLGSLSQFDYYGRPIRDVFEAAPDLTPYVALVPAVPLGERNPAGTPGSEASARLDLEGVDRADDELFNRILWRAIKGERVPYPGATRMSGLEWKRSR